MGACCSVTGQCRAAAESSRPRARLQSEALTKILLGLGTILNIPDPQGQKAIWLPRTQVRFLGLIVDAANQRFLLPQEKAQDLIQLAANIIDSPEVSNRQLAQMAGKMIAAAPAIQLSRLFAGSLYKAMTMEIGWDTIYPSSEAMNFVRTLNWR